MPELVGVAGLEIPDPDPLLALTQRERAVARNLHVQL
jgi:hypothetical protein